MKEILLVRHAKSSWDTPSLDDFDRPLAARGREAAPLVGRVIAGRGWLPDRVLVSPALRARQTWARIRAVLDDPPRASHPDALYMGSAATLMDLVRAAPAATARLLIVGHNPGLEELAQTLAGRESDARALERLKGKFPTAALARLAFDGAWAGLAPGGARLVDFVRPKDTG